MDINTVVLIGRLTKTPEVRKTNDGKSVCNFTIAVGNGKDREADFIQCVTFNHSADFLGNYAGKGDQVAVSGKITSNKWEDESGQMRYSQDVVAFRVQLLQQVQRDPQMEVHEEEHDEPVLDIGSDDLPF